MLSKLKLLLLLPAMLLGRQTVNAQDHDYLKHGKIFCICSIKKDCAHCYDCEQQRYKVKIDNHADKQIKSISYSYYSEAYNKVMEKEAKVQGGHIDHHETGYLYVCVSHGQHWIISKITYADESVVNFKLHERLENFTQEPDECDCND